MQSYGIRRLRHSDFFKLLLPPCLPWSSAVFPHKLKSHTHKKNKKNVYPVLHSHMSEYFPLGQCKTSTEKELCFLQNILERKNMVLTLTTCFCYWRFWIQRVSQKSEPDNWRGTDPNGENCAVARNFSDYLNSWSDISCNNQNKFICENIF